MTTPTLTEDSARELVQKWRWRAALLNRIASNPRSTEHLSPNHQRAEARAEGNLDCARELEALLGEETR